MASASGLRRYRITATASSVRTGIILLILLGVASATGTLVLQRPLTDPAELERAYSPEKLRWLDGLGFTDVFHSWWFATLLAVLCLNIVLASVKRFPTAWRFFTRPYRRAERQFLAGLPLQLEITIPSAKRGVSAAERAFRRMGLKPQRLGTNGDLSLYAERNRTARLAAYVVHASLLLIFGGAIADAVWGYRGFVALERGQEVNQIELRDGTRKTLPFTLRCDGAGQANYPDGTPRRWWSKLAVLENGREIKQKEIEVNAPLIHGGLRIFQSSYGLTGQVDAIQLTAIPKAGPAKGREFALRPNETVALDAKTTVRLGAFVPDFILRGNQIESRSEEPKNPAILLLVGSKKSGEAKVWLFPRFPGFLHPDSSPYAFEFRGVATGYFTGLQVSHEPGQWAVWAGVILMGLGLFMAFYLVHVRVWAVPINDGRGRQVLWVGASVNKNRDDFAVRFGKLTEEIQKNLEAESKPCAAPNAALLSSS